MKLTLPRVGDTWNDRGLGSFKVLTSPYLHRTSEVEPITGSMTSWIWKYFRYETLNFKLRKIS